MSLSNPIYGWKLLLVGGGWIVLATIIFWIARDEVAWRAFWQHAPDMPKRRRWLIAAWCFSMIGFFLAIGSFLGSDNAADLAGCTWWVLAGGLSSAITGLVVKAYRAST